MENRTKYWLVLYLFVILAFLSFIFSFPTVPVNFKFAGREIKKTFSGPDINFQLFGKDFYKEINLQLGSDLGGGTRFVLQGDLKDVAEEERDSVLEKTKNIMNERIQFFNLTEPRIYTSKTEDEHRIVLELADEENAMAAAAIASQNAKLEIREIKEEFKESTDPNVMYDSNSYADAAVSSSDVIGSSIKNNPNTGAPIIKLRLTNEGKDKFSEMAVRNAGGFVAIFLDGSIISFQGIDPEVKIETAGEPIISGNFTGEQVKLLNILINAGSLPFPVSLADQSPFASKFDNNTVKSGILAISAGVLLAGIFLIYRHKILGFLGVVSLAAYFLFLIAILKVGVPAILLWIFTGEFGREILISVRLTFAGILGIFAASLLIFMTQISIFEKLKKKIKGMNFVELIEESFRNTWTRIRSGMFFTVAACIFLGQFGTGQLKNFSVTLSLGLLIGIFFTFSLTRVLVLLFHRNIKR